ncbi:MAG: tRNA pseudouridine(38-40) synthase TruA [Negativicutes bacterium]|nr:tRNA pseudouridine(38-40) synthase TruA [Negativicutes bacterium]
MERNLKLTIAYDGTAYHGFQRQANALAVQEVLEERLAKIFGHPLKMAGAARTDTGVHAYGQVVSFVTAGSIPVDRIPAASRGVLPDDIVIVAAEEVPRVFHARTAAKSKIYCYRIHTSPTPDPLLRNYAWHLLQTPDVAAMNTAVRHIVGTHDFSAFRAAGGAAKSPVRTMIAASCQQEGQILECRFWGNGFLYHMVRNLVGTLVEVGLGRMTDEEFDAVLVGRDRHKAGVTAPPQGLYLKEVFYKDIDSGR